MNEEALILWILRSLGAPIIEVELTQETLEDCVEDAKRWFSAKKGATSSRLLIVVSGQSPLTLDPDVEVVQDVSFASANSTLSDIASGGAGVGFNGVDSAGGILVGTGSFPFAAGGNSTGFASSRSQALTYFETLRKTNGMDLDWKQEGRKLHLFPKEFPSGYLRIAFRTNMPMLEELPELDHMLVKRYALAKAKERLGIIRRKRDSYAGSQGSVSLDGNTMKDEAQAEIEALDAEILVLPGDYPFAMLLG